MRFISIAILIANLNFSRVHSAPPARAGQLEPCLTYACDSLAVRVILDSSGHTDVEVVDVTDTVLGDEEKQDTIAGRIAILDLENKNIHSLPPEIGQLICLYELRLNSNQLTFLPPEIGRLKLLRYLFIANNKLSALPHEIGELFKLRTIVLSGNQLTDLPDEVNRLRNLRQIILSDNQLTSLPPINRLERIGILEIDNNKLSSLTPQISMSKNSCIKLSVSNNQLTSLPPEIGECKWIKELDVSNNKLSSLPPEIGNMENLNKLVLSDNQLTLLPGEILNLDFTYLRIQLNNNRLCDLQDSISNWIDEYSDDSFWHETQMLDDTHYCDGTTDTKYPAVQTAPNPITIQYQPFSDFVSLTFYSGSKGKDVSVYSLKGLLMERLHTNGGGIIWDTRGYDTGVYYLKLTIDGKSFVRKIVL